MEKGIDVLFTFDTTGSMYPCLTQVRRDVEKTIQRITKDIPNIRIAIIAHGDYCDKNTTYITKSFDFSKDVKRICDFVKSVDRTNGGDTPECYELVLNEARSLDWKAGNEKVFVMIGDDVPHEKNYPQNTKRLDWRNELDLLLEAGIHVYGVHAMPGIRRHSTYFYEQIAEKTNGYYLTLDQFAAITDIILAICYKQSGPEPLKKFEDEVQTSRKMTSNMQYVFERLSGRPITKRTPKAGLVAVPPGRFQIIPVDQNQAIRDFVNDQGLTFRVGRGFYQFTKSEMIQERKEVVLMDKYTGDMFSGSAARDMIGLPFGMRGRIKPANLSKYDVFVQSTSYNRKLKPGTLFLYEVEDC